MDPNRCRYPLINYLSLIVSTALPRWYEMFFLILSKIGFRFSSISKSTHFSREIPLLGVITLLPRTSQISHILKNDWHWRKIGKFLTNYCVAVQSTAVRYYPEYALSEQDYIFRGTSSLSHQCIVHILLQRTTSTTACWSVGPEVKLRPPTPHPQCVLKWVLRGHFLGIKIPQWN